MSKQRVAATVAYEHCLYVKRSYIHQTPSILSIYQFDLFDLICILFKYRWKRHWDRMGGVLGWICVQMDSLKERLIVNQGVSDQQTITLSVNLRDTRV